MEPGQEGVKREMQASMLVLKRYYNQRHLVRKVVLSRIGHLVGRRETVDPSDLQGWAPFLLRRDFVVWVDMKEQRLKNGFAEREFLRAARRPRSVRTTSLETLEAMATAGSRPTGFVFHVSRCGSTLLRNMLAAVSGSLALGEPLIVSEVLGGDVPPERRAARLEGTIRSLCHPYAGDETRFFIKLQSSCTVDLELFRTCFPDTPVVYLYRDPIEVMVACLHEGGSNWMRARSDPRVAARLTGLDAKVVRDATAEEYAARTIGHYLERAHAQRGPLLPVNYSRLLRPETLEAICRFFGLADVGAAVEQMRAASQPDAKRRGDFVPDADRRRRAASPAMSAAAERWCAEPYRRLDALSESRVRDLAGCRVGLSAGAMEP